MFRSQHPKMVPGTENRVFHVVCWLSRKELRGVQQLKRVDAISGLPEWASLGCGCPDLQCTSLPVGRD